MMTSEWPGHPAMGPALWLTPKLAGRMLLPLALLALVLTSGCANIFGEQPSVQLEGPALVMFFTDN